MSNQEQVIKFPLPAGNFTVFTNQPMKYKVQIHKNGGAPTVRWGPTGIEVTESDIGTMVSKYKNLEEDNIDYDLIEELTGRDHRPPTM